MPWDYGLYRTNLIYLGGEMYNSEKHVTSSYQAFERQFSFEGTSQEHFQSWQDAFRPRLRSILGLDNLESDLRNHIPIATLKETHDMGSYDREHWEITVEPTVPLPFYLLRPKSLPKTPPLVLTPHGHNHPHLYVGIAETDAEALHITSGDRDIAVQAVQEGYVVISPTTRAFGDTRTLTAIEAGQVSSCRDQLVHGLLAGRTPIGERVWDISCLISWALTNIDVDKNRIGITGNSGGGTISLFAAACDTRISVSMPGCYFCTFKGSIGSINHCECNYVPGLLRLAEMSDVAGLIAPRPFIAIAGKEDEIFPIEQVRTAFSDLKRIYSVAGVPEHCTLYVGNGGHRYYKDGAWPSLERYFSS